MNNDKSPPAFPSGSDDYDGMTLRDYFAGKALQGFCAMANSDGAWAWGPADAADIAYDVAEAMLARRNK